MDSIVPITMDQRKRKQQETPFKTIGTNDPTATWKPNVRPDKSFHFSWRKKSKITIKKTPESSEGLLRFQQRRGTQTIIRDGKIAQRGDFDFVDERSRRRTKKERISHTNKDQAFEKCQRVVALGNDSGTEDPFAFPSTGEQTKNESPSSSVASKQRTPASIIVDLESGANSKKNPKVSCDGNNQKETFTKNCSKVLAEKPKTAPVETSLASREPIPPPGNCDNHKSSIHDILISQNTNKETKIPALDSPPTTALSTRSTCKNHQEALQRKDDLLNPSDFKNSASDLQQIQRSETKRSTHQLLPTDALKNRRQETIQIVAPVGIKKADEIPFPQDAINEKSTRLLDSHRTIVASIPSITKTIEDPSHHKMPIEDAMKQSTLEISEAKVARKTTPRLKRTDNRKLKRSNFKISKQNKTPSEHVQTSNQKGIHAVVPRCDFRETNVTNEPSTGGKQSTQSGKTFKAKEPSNIPSEADQTENQKAASTSSRMKMDNRFGNPMTSTQIDTSQDYCSLQRALRVDKPERKASSLKCIRKNLDRAMVDEEYGSDYNDYHRNEYQRISSKRTLVRQRSSFFSSKNILSHSTLADCGDHYQRLSNQMSAVGTFPHDSTSTFFGHSKADKLKKEFDIPKLSLMSIPKTSLMRDETQATYDVMGLSPAEAFHERARDVDKDFRLDCPSSEAATAGSIGRSPFPPNSIRPSNHYRNILDVSSSSDSESETVIVTSNSSQRSRTFATPKPRQLFHQFDAVGTAAPAKTVKFRLVPSRSANTSCRNHGEVTDDIPKYIFGKTEGQRSKIETTKKDSTIEKNSIGRISSGRENGNKPAFKSKRKNRKSMNIDSDELARRSSLNVRPKLIAADTEKESTFAFKRRDRGSYGLPRKRAKTMSELSAMKLKENIRHVSLSPATTRKPPRQNHLWIEKEKRAKQKINRDCDNSSDGSDWGNVSIDNIPHEESYPSDEISKICSSSGSGDYYAADDEDNVELGPRFRKSGKRDHISSKGGESKARKKSSKKTILARVVRKEPRGSVVTNGVKKAFFILSFFYIFAPWEKYGGRNTFMVQNSANNLERRKRMLHRIRFSQNPNFALIQDDGTEKTATL